MCLGGLLFVGLRHDVKLTVGNILDKLVAILEAELFSSVIQCRFTICAAILVTEIDLRGLIAFGFSFCAHMYKIAQD